ncbi:hypothetical protein MKZ38_003960 [Zalerion maritima]|uniref:Uncharacterized protein n=1 Tax=Zalerion maritima TaxID=339359 RepID=A0AAD5RTJ6_9PEZI|nr:hypothetical protein MKZ38_003960 [Zalerion maritima]
MGDAWADNHWRVNITQPSEGDILASGDNSLGVKWTRLEDKNDGESCLLTGIREEFEDKADLNDPLAVMKYKSGASCLSHEQRILWSPNYGGTTTGAQYHVIKLYHNGLLAGVSDVFEIVWEDLTTAGKTTKYPAPTPISSSGSATIALTTTTPPSSADETEIAEASTQTPETETAGEEGEYVTAASSNDGNKDGIIAGSVLGAVLVAVLLALVWFYRRKAKMALEAQKRDQEPESGNLMHKGPTFTRNAGDETAQGTPEFPLALFGKVGNTEPSQAILTGMELAGGGENKRDDGTTQFLAELPGLLDQNKGLVGTELASGNQNHRDDGTPEFPAELPETVPATSGGGGGDLCMHSTPATVSCAPTLASETEGSRLVQWVPMGTHGLPTDFIGLPI